MPRNIGRYIGYTVNSMKTMRGRWEEEENVNFRRLAK
jgi:hypothetical protein